MYHWNFSHSRNKCSLLLKTRHLPTGYWVFLPTYTRLPSPKQDQNRERQDKRSSNERYTCTQGWVWISPCHTSTFVRGWTEYRKTEFQIQTPWCWNCSILEKCKLSGCTKGNSCCCCCCFVSVMSNSVWSHRRQPTKLLCPWDSPGKNTGVGCHFLLQCMHACKVTSVVSDSVQTYGQQPTRLLCPQDSLGKNTGVGCHFLKGNRSIV